MTRPEFVTCIVGTRFRGQRAVAALTGLRAGDAVRLVREPQNPHDPFAVACHYRGMHVGYIPRQANKLIAEALDAGLALTCMVREPAEIRGEFIKVEPKLSIAWPER